MANVICPEYGDFFRTRKTMNNKEKYYMSTAIDELSEIARYEKMWSCAGYDNDDYRYGGYSLLKCA